MVNHVSAALATPLVHTYSIDMVIIPQETKKPHHEWQGFQN